jgi:exodeoxyribonuclease VII large subunit
MRELPKPSAPIPKPPEVYTVSQLNQQVKRLLEDCFPEIWVEGEVSNVSRPASGHCYFSLKDQHAHIRCALFRARRQLLDYEPDDGNHVLVRARVTLYEARGDFQLVIQHIEDAGEGVLRRAFEALKRKLEQQGLFDLQHKKALPSIPTRVGIITSPSGAALRDILSTFQRRSPAVPLLIYPTSVQGAAAASEIAAAVRLAGTRNECDVVILARGGGSLEDLWPFNDENVARTIFDCPIPIVSGVGHETDFTIADFVADHRAATPSAAAELVSPDTRELTETVIRLGRNVIRQMQRRLEQASQHMDWLAKRIVHPQLRLINAGQRLSGLGRRLTATMHNQGQQRQGALMRLGARLLQKNPGVQLRIFRAQADVWPARMGRAVNLHLERRRHRLSAAAGRLHGVSPLATLERGYALVTDTDSGRVITETRRLKLRDRVHVRLARGQLECIIDEILEP